MNIEPVLLILLWLVAFFAVGWFAQWVITTFFPEPIRTPAMLIVGVILLVLAIWLIAGRGSLRIGSAAPARVTG